MKLSLRFEAMESCPQTEQSYVLTYAVASGGKVIPGAVVTPWCLLNMGKPGDAKLGHQAGLVTVGGWEKDRGCQGHPHRLQPGSTVRGCCPMAGMQHVGLICPHAWL